MKSLYIDTYKIRLVNRIGTLTSKETYNKRHASCYSLLDWSEGRFLQPVGKLRPLRERSERECSISFRSKRPIVKEINGIHFPQ